ncbi:hypothetical protein HWI79_756 [Cryptosporidium felis]|nr:hypothetical protein HWI79_756 [Cryptosporidium felis]
MSTIYASLIERYISRNPSLRSNFIGIFKDVGIEIEGLNRDKINSNIDYTDTSDRIRICGFILLLVSSNDHFGDKKILFKYLRNFLSESLAVLSDEVKYNLFVIQVFNHFLNFIVDATNDDIHEILYNVQINEQSHYFIERYLILIRYSINDIFDLFISPSFINGKELLCSDNFVISIDGIMKLDILIKKILIYVLGINFSNYLNQPSIEVDRFFNNLTNCYITHQKITLSIFSILNRISSIIMILCNSIIDLVNYLNILTNANNVCYSDKIEKVKINNIINFIVKQMLLKDNIRNMQKKEIIASIGLYSSFLYISHEITNQNLNGTNELSPTCYIENISEFVKNNGMPAISEAAFYKGAIVLQSILNESIGYEFQSLHYELYRKAFQSIVFLFNCDKSELASVFSLLSLHTWISKFKNEILIINEKIVKNHFSFYLQPTLDMLLSFLDQPVSYCSKLVNQVLEEFIDYLLVLGSIFREDYIIEISSKPIDWFIGSLLDYSWNNLKFKFLSMQILFNGILNYSKGNNLFEFLSFGRLLSLNNLNLDISKIYFTNFYSECKEMQFLYHLAFSLTSNQLSSSAEHLILAWYKLRRKLNKTNHIESNNEFLDYILFSSIQILNINNPPGDHETREILVIERRIRLLTRIFQIIKRSDMEYYDRKLPILFDYFFRLNKQFNDKKQLNCFQLLLLIELRMNKYLFWRNEINEKYDSTTCFDLFFILKQSKTFHYIVEGSLILDSIQSNDSNVLSITIEFLSIPLLPSMKRKLFDVFILNNELNCLLILLRNINISFIPARIINRTVSIFDGYFKLVKNSILNSNIVTKNNYLKWLNKIFIYLRSSIGPQKCDKSELSVPIFRSFIDTFYCETGFEAIFGVSDYSSKDLIYSIAPSLQSQLFSKSDICRKTVSDLFIKSSKTGIIFTKFHSSIFEGQNELNFNRVTSLFCGLIKKVKPREYFPSCILLYSYILQAFKYENRKNMIAALIKSIGILQAEEITNIDNINYFISEIFYFELLSRIKLFLNDENPDKYRVIFGNNNIPLQGLIHLLEISLRLEFSDISKDLRFEICKVSVELIYLLTVVLYILSDCEETYTGNENLIEYEFHSNDKNTFMKYNYSRVNDETCKVLSLILLNLDLDLIFLALRDRNSNIIHSTNKNNAKLNAFVNTLNSAFSSKNYYSFVYQLSVLYVDLIINCNHPGNSNCLFDIFSALISSIIKISNNSFSKKDSSTKARDLSTLQMDLQINKQDEKQPNFNLISPKIHSPTHRIQLENNANTEECQLNLSDDLYDLPETLLLIIIYSVLETNISFLSNIDGNTDIITNARIEHEKINDIFSRIVRGNTYEEKSVTIPLFNLSELILFTYDKSDILAKINIPHPKRKSQNLCKIICILNSFIVKNPKNKYLIKSVIKLLIVASFEDNLFERRYFERDAQLFPHSDDFRCNIHCNNILATIVSHSKTGNGSGSFYELFDLNMLSGSLISALNNIKIYNSKYRNENRFSLCNSSLNLMSSLIKRCSCTVNGIEHCTYNISDHILKNGYLFKGEILSPNLSKGLSITFEILKTMGYMNTQISDETNYLYSCILSTENSTLFSLRSIKKTSPIFERSIIDILLNSTDTYFQGMILLFLIEISLTWHDCSFDLAICIIKSIYSKSYFIRVYSSRLLADIIIRTLNMKRECISFNEFDTSIDKRLYSIFICNSVNKEPTKYSILNLIFESIEISFSISGIIKYNLIHGIITLATSILKRPNMKLYFSLLLKENKNGLILKKMFILLKNSLQDFYFQIPILKSSILELLSLLMELDPKIHEDLNIIECWNSLWDKYQNFSLLGMSHESNFAKLNNLLFYDIVDRTNFIKIFVNKVMQFGDFGNLEKLLLKDEFGSKHCKLIHPKILLEFYSSVMENQLLLTDYNLKRSIKSISNIMHKHLLELKYLISSNTLELKMQNKQVDGNLLIISLENAIVLIEYLFSLALNENMSRIFITNKISNSILILIFDFLNDELHKSTSVSFERQIYNTAMDFKCYSRYLLSPKNYEFIIKVSIIFMRFFKYIYMIYERKEYLSILQKLTFETIYKISEVKIESKLLVCNLIQIIFEIMTTELPKNNCEENFLNNPVQKIETNETITSLFDENNEYWYSLMICVIFLLIDDVFEVRNKSANICKVHYNVICYFCNHFLQKSKSQENFEFRYTNNLMHNIKQIILLNDQYSCLFSLKLLEALTSNLVNENSQNKPESLFPKEINYMNNEYMYISHATIEQISKYLESPALDAYYRVNHSVIESYLESWRSEIERSGNLFRRIFNCFIEFPIQFHSIEILGNILNNEINTLNSLIMVGKFIVVTKYMSKKYGNRLFEDVDVNQFEEYFDFLWSTKKCTANKPNEIGGL